MPNNQAQIFATIWQDHDFQKLTIDAQRLFFLLLSQPDINNAGVLPLRLSKWAKGCIHTDTSHLRYTLDELQERRFAYYDDDTEEVLVRSYLRRSGILKHPYMAKSALRCARQTESSALVAVLIEELLRTRRNDAKQTAEQMASKQHPDAIQTASESHSNPIQTPSRWGMPSECHRDAYSESESKSVSETLVDGWVGEAPPKILCPKHPDGTDEPCNACRKAREQNDADAAARAAAHRTQRETFWADVRSSPCCDDTGWTEDDTGDVIRCPNHDFETLQVNTEENH